MSEQADATPGTVTEVRTTHRYYFYHRWVGGYGPSMDPHYCGDSSQPCVTVTEEREVSPWRVVATERKGGDK